MLPLVLSIFYILISFTCELDSVPLHSRQILLVFSYDGFRNEYLTRGITPNMIKFRQKGVYTERLINVFPTKTFTNHFSIATGLYPESHGVIANSLYDPKYGKIGYSSEMFHFKKDILPIWTLNEKAGGTSGCMMWPGYDFDYHNINCTYGEKFAPAMSMKDRVDTVMNWITNKKKPANFVMAYLEQPDKIGHRVGPNSPETDDFIKQMDDITEYIQRRLKELNIINCTNVIHLSDHGMESVTSPFFLDFRPYLTNDTYKVYGTSPVLQIVPIDDENTQTIYESLKNASHELGHFQVFKQGEALERWHVNSKRFGPIVVVADLGYAFYDMYSSAEYFNKKYNISISPETKYGIHGYDNKYPEMSAYFMAKGPAFRKAHIIEPPFSVVDLYDLFVNLLKIPNPPPTSGSFDNVRGLLEDQKSHLSFGSMMIYKPEWHKTICRLP